MPFLIYWIVNLYGYYAKFIYTVRTVYRSSTMTNEVCTYSQPLAATQTNNQHFWKSLATTLKCGPTSSTALYLVSQTTLGVLLCAGYTKDRVTSSIRLALTAMLAGLITYSEGFFPTPMTHSTWWPANTVGKYLQFKQRIALAVLHLLFQIWSRITWMLFLTLTLV